MASLHPVHVVVLQHMDAGHPWYLRELLREAGATWSSLRPGPDLVYPDPADCDAVWVMGGAMQVWQEEEHPWLAPEKRFIREVVRAGVPYLGICLGHQLLASALGGQVGEASAPEIGLFDVSMTPHGAESAWFEGCQEGARLQWHKAEVLEAPAEAQVLARSERCAVQAMAVDSAALSVQYHVEADTQMLPTWCTSESARATLDERFGGDGLEHFQRDAIETLPALQGHARRLFRNWLAAIS